MYDPDPIASLRKRRVSTDSHDSTASHGDLRSKEDQIVAAARKSSKLADNSFPMETKKKNKSGEKMKKKHKKCSKHGHHHCHKHKHKRHKSGGEVVASSSKKTHDQKFAIRSPPHPGSRFVKSDQENNESSEEASQEESDQQNSSDDEVSFSCHARLLLHVESCVDRCKQTRGRLFVADNSQFNKLGARDQVVTCFPFFTDPLVSLWRERFCRALLQLGTLF